MRYNNISNMRKTAIRASTLNWWQKRSRNEKRVVIGTAGLIAMVVGFQLVYPANRALPFAKLDNDNIGFATKEHIQKVLLANYSKTSITTVVRDKKSQTKLAETGITYDDERIVDELSDYAWYWRLVPLSIFVKGALTNRDVVTKIDDEVFSQYAAERSAECEIVPKNAGVVVKNGHVVLDPARDGENCPKNSLRHQLTAVPLQKSGTTVYLKTSVVKPTRSDADVSALLKQARVVASRKVTVDVAGKPYTPDQPTIASWLVFPEDSVTKKLSVGTSSEAIKKYLETIQKDVYIAPGTTVITTHDGKEVARAEGANGRGIDMDRTAAIIAEQVQKADGTVAASFASLPPKMVYNRSYSKTPEGFQALVTDLAKDKGDIAIAVRKLGDNGVHVNGSKQYHPASTYKLFAAYSVLKRVDSGQMNWGQTTSGGQTLSQCFDNMIVNSDNACAEWFGGTIGWAVLTAEARSFGATGTNLSRPFVSTANDMALFLQKLESNQLGLSEPSRARLIDVMKRQIFRKGIPAGIGVPVANKVGFIDSYLHDAAIVYAPSGVYVLVIYSSGSSWAQIAEVAARIHTQLQ